MLAKAITEYEAQVYCGKTNTAWYESLLAATDVDQVDSRKTSFASRGVWNVLLYRLLDVSTWLKCEMPIPLEIRRGHVPLLNLPVSVCYLLSVHLVIFA
jgi:hypothetical protein